MSEPSPAQNNYNNDGQGPMATLSSDTAKEVTLASSEESASSVSAGLYFFIVWLVLLILIITLLCITIDCRSKRKVNQQHQQQQQHEQQSHDTEAGEQQTSTMQTETRSKKFNNGIGITVLFLGSLIGLGLSVFSNITCEFVTFDTPLTMGTFYRDSNDEFSVLTFRITVYSLGLWKVDLTSNTYLSGCVDTNLLFFQEDALYKFAKVSSVLACVIGGISTLILMFLLIIGKRVRYLVWPFMLAAFFQLMTLTLFGSSYCKNDGFNLQENDGINNCQFSLGAIASITSALYWILEVFAARFINFIDPIVDPSYSI
jgi:heme exporter protein D